MVFRDTSLSRSPRNPQIYARRLRHDASGTLDAAHNYRNIYMVIPGMAPHALPPSVKFRRQEMGWLVCSGGVQTSCAIQRSYDRLRPNL